MACNEKKPLPGQLAPPPPYDHPLGFIPEVARRAQTPSEYQESVRKAREAIEKLQEKTRREKEEHDNPYLSFLMPQQGEVRIVSETGGAKGSKPARFDLIPSNVLWELAEHYGKGNEKYPPDPVTGEPNWQKGYDWSLNIAAMQRHLHQWLMGEEYDRETGSSHLVAAIWHLVALRWFEVRGKGKDTRR